MIVPMLLLCLQEPSSLQTAAPVQPVKARPKDLSDALGVLLAAELGGGSGPARHQASWFGVVFPSV